MKIVLQRVKEAYVEVDGQVVGKIGKGLCLLAGIEKGDEGKEADRLAKKVTELRVFADSEGKMNLSVGDVGGEILAVSQFTLAGSTHKGRRPSFDGAEEPHRANSLFCRFVESMRNLGFRVETGVFQAIMDVHLVNDGPVTFILEGKKGEPGSVIIEED
jgi:D-tyrosyl-tRNA(Tyr) deacylase